MNAIQVQILDEECNRKAFNATKEKYPSTQVIMHDAISMEPEAMEYFKQQHREALQSLTKEKQS